MIITQKRVVILIIILTILCTSLVLANTKVKDTLSQEDNNKLSKSLQLLDENEEKEVIIKIKNKDTILKDKEIKDTIHPKLVKGKFKGSKLISLAKNNNIELIEEDVDVNLTGEIIPYGVTYTNAPLAWETTTGEGIKVAVLDTGISPHDDLTITGGYPANDYTDNVNHGTPVAGVINAVANDANLYAVKIMNAATGKISDAIAGLQWAIDNNMDIVVMSFGTPVNSQIFKEILEDAYDKGILLVAAGGNNGQILYPAKYSSVIAVGSVDEYNHSLTPQGFELELVAVGDHVYTTTNNNGHNYFSGTSLAAPHIAGIAALLKAYNPDFTNKQLRGKLQNDAVDLGEQNKDDLYGFGLAQVNLETNDYELFEFQYNYTVYKYVNETSVLYAEGFGNLDDVDFEEGRYHAIKRYNDKEYYEEFVVGEGGVVEVLTINIYFSETWTPFEGDGNDNRVFKNQGLNAGLTTNSSTVVECFDMKGDGTYEDCYAETGTDMTNCRNKFTELNNMCNGATDCSGIDNIYTGAVTSDHSIDTSSRGSFTTYAKYYTDCTGTGITESAQSSHYVFDRRRITCEIDGERMYEGRYDIVPVTYLDYILNSACSTGKTCDPLLDQNDSSDPVNEIPDVCRVPDSGICSVNSDCLTGHYCIEGVCDDVSVNICDGRFDITVLDAASNPMSGMYVYLEGVNNGTTDTNGQKSIPFNDVICNNLRNVSIRCFNNQTRECAFISDTIVKDNTGNVNSFAPQGCNVCRGVPNLKIDLGDLNLIQTSKNNFDIIANVSSENVQANNVIVAYTPLNKNTGLIEQSQAKNGSINLVSSDRFKTSSVNMNLDNIDYMYIQVDPNKQVNEDKKDNFVIVPVIKKKEKVKLIVKTGNNKANEAIEEYLKLFVNANDTDYDFIISVGNPNKNPDSGIPSNITASYYNNGYYDKDKRKVIFNHQESKDLLHIGLVNRFGPDKIVVYGNDIEGTVAAVKRLINAREVFLHFPLFFYASYLDEYDTLGLRVLDLMQSPENKPFRDTETEQFKKIVSDILNDNNYEIAIKTVKTTNDNTTLRLKNLNSDFSDKFKEVINTSKPVVMSGGIFSNLQTFEDGLGGELAEEGYDVWTIEMTGGPETECNTCANYTYQDLVDYYWPALIAGVMNYSGKTKIDYIGHSNGCRAALSSLNSYSNSGKNDAGNCFNLVTGQYDIGCDVPSLPVDKFFGIACPAVLNEGTSFTSATRVDLLPVVGPKLGRIAMATIFKSHVTMKDLTIRLIPLVYQKGELTLGQGLLTISSLFTSDKISRNLLDFYVNLSINQTSTFNVSNVNVNSITLFNGKPSDFIVPIEDQTELYNNLTVQNKTVVSVDSGLFPVPLFNDHSAMKENKKVVKGIKEGLK